MKTKFNEFVNEDKNEKYDTFKINVLFEVGSIDIDSKGILLSALQKTNMGWGDYVRLDKYSLNNPLVNSDVKLTQTNCKYENETFEVKYNEYHDGDYDTEDNVFNYVKECIESIKYYSYRSVHSMDDRQRAEIKILSIKKI